MQQWWGLLRLRKARACVHPINRHNALWNHPDRAGFEPAWTEVCSSKLIVADTLTLELASQPTTEKTPTTSEWLSCIFNPLSFEPTQEIMVLIALCLLNLQTCMCRNPLHVWFLVKPFVCFHTLCVRTVKSLARLRRCAVSPEPSLFA